ncbi:MAG TPA: hypothetical protein VMM12_03210 [Longimicrobiales bacterium]|nr:hypothetical protein [Longimicrobiales bacterium]
MSTPLAVRRPSTVLRVWGRDPVKMLHGLATADIGMVSPDRAVYTAFLTPKGRMVADGLVLLSPGAEPPELLLATDPAAAPGLLDHLRKFVPPLFARFEDVSAAWSVVGVYGTGASAAAEAGLGAAGVEATLSPDLPEDVVGARSPEPPALAVRSAVTGADGWDLYVPADRAAAVESALEAAGARAGGEEDLEPLRIAAGRPRWGAELTDSVIPLEAGLLGRAISQTKGCYTGQEVIVRILHRGHVNRQLRALSFRGPAPPRGTELFEPGSDRPRGVVTSAAALPGGSGGAGLGYVRREVEPPAELRAGSPDGAPVRVTALP